jgi:hypothetical protein
MNHHMIALPRGISMARFIQGRISYIAGTDTPTPHEFGREFFSISVQKNGLRTMRAVCEFVEEGITRDVTYTVGADFRPLECYVRVALEDRVVGSGWFRFDDTIAEGEGFTAAEGRFHQRIKVPERVKAFGSHPICSDIWRLAHLKATGKDQPQVLTNCMNSSPLAHGESGPILGQREYTYFYRGAETVTVPAGSYDCQRFDWPVRAGKTLCMWASGADYLPVRITFPEGNKRYDLMEISVRR